MRCAAESFDFRFEHRTFNLADHTWTMLAKLTRFLCFALVTLVSTGAVEFRIGVASVDITPEYPIRLSGYASRKTESEGVRQPLKGKAIALDQGNGQTALILSLDNCGITREIWSEITGRIERAHSIPADRVVIFSSHTHSAPALTGAINNLFVAPLPPNEQATVDRYTRELTDKMVQIAAEALKEMHPIRLYFGQGRASFAKNRRNEGGPVDHDLPVLVARTADGKPKAILANYACHCTTLQGDHNFIHPDWAGLAQAGLEDAIPGLTALVSIGCGADANPNPRGQVEHAVSHGEELAREVQAMLDLPMDELTGAVEFRAENFDLPFDPLPSREEWEKRAKEQGIVGYHAQQNLARLDRGETLPTVLPYRVQTWNFGEQLAMVFLPGEVVVDYSRRLKRELDPARLWVSSYANFVPCYIPSVRILEEGGYEAESSLWYYDRPARLSTNTESLIISSVHRQIPDGFQHQPKFGNFPEPRSPEHSLAAIRTEPQLKVQLVAAEPLIASPVAIDWSADGKLWVVEMRDFPSGMDGKYKAGGRVQVLEDLDGDGAMDRAVTFIEDLPFPTGITCWNGGALICAAPDIIFARDTNGDGKADEVRKLFSGFATDNYQARVNSLSLGLDGWFYGANGLIGGRITGGALKVPLNIGNRDFRFQPDTGAFETASGITQQGRVRDDFGNWFGCDNSTLIWHYPIHDHYLRRNPHTAPASTRVSNAAGDDPNKLFPISETQERFNHPDHVNRTTAACGLGLYRDDLLGPDFYGDAFICEPVHNLVRRMELEPDGATFKARKPLFERREFLASQDSWFRPVQARTGPDGGLWVVDMYRMVVEHPRWITPERLETLDMRAGDDKGRIYRVLPRKGDVRRIENLERLEIRTLASRLSTSNGTERDRVHLELAKRGDQNAVEVLNELAKSSDDDAVQVQALSVLKSLGALRPQHLLAALQSERETVRAFGASLSDAYGENKEIEQQLVKMSGDPSLNVRLQLACALGNFPSADSTRALTELVRNSPDPWTRAAALSSANGRSLEIAEQLETPDPELIRPLVDSALGENSSAQPRILRLIARAGSDLQVWQLEALRAVARAQRLAAPEAKVLFARAQEIAASPSITAERKVAALRAIAFSPDSTAQNVIQVALSSVENAEVTAVAADSMVTRGPLDSVYSEWTQLSPAVRRAISTAVLRRPDLLGAHLKILEETRSQAELSIADRQQLLKSPNAKIREQAQRLFASSPDSSRADALKKYEKLNLHSASAGRGAGLFATHCASCHHFRGQGFAVGPNLGALTDRSVPFLLGAILDPNAAVENRYLGYSVETKDGVSLHGIITDENAASLTVANANGLKQQILRKDITSIQPSQLSLMPEGLEQTFSTADMADLITYLQFTPATFGTASGERATRARESFGKTGTPADITFASEQLSYPSWMGHLPFHHCRQTDGSSRVEWEAPVRTNQLAEAIFEFPAALGLVSQPKGSFDLSINGRMILKFDVANSDESWESADGNVRANYLVMDRNTEDSSGILRILVKPGIIEGSTAKFSVRGSAAQSQRWFGIYELPDTRTAQKSP